MGDKSPKDKEKRKKKQAPSKKDQSKVTPGAVSPLKK
jgi:hypothetical protein